MFDFGLVRDILRRLVTCKFANRDHGRTESQRVSITCLRFANHGRSRTESQRVSITSFSQVATRVFNINVPATANRRLNDIGCRRVSKTDLVAANKRLDDAAGDVGSNFDSQLRTRCSITCTCKAGRTSSALVRVKLSMNQLTQLLGINRCPSRDPSQRACAWDRSHKCPPSAFPTCSEDTRMRQGFMIGVPSSARTPTAHPSMLTGVSFKILVISCTSGCFHPSHQRGHSNVTLPPASRTGRATLTNVLINSRL